MLGVFPSFSGFRFLDAKSPGGLHRKWPVWNTVWNSAGREGGECVCGQQSPGRKMRRGNASGTEKIGGKLELIAARRPVSRNTRKLP